MDILINILFWLHLVALVGAGTGAIVTPIVGGQMASAGPEARQSLAAIGQRIAMTARGSLVVLLITGPLLFWLRWQFTAPSMIWFGIKMVLVLVILACVIVSGINFKKAQGGDMAARKTAFTATRIMGIALIGVILAAVFAFD